MPGAKLRSGVESLLYDSDSGILPLAPWRLAKRRDFSPAPAALAADTSLCLWWPR